MLFLVLGCTLPYPTTLKSVKNENPRSRFLVNGVEVEYIRVTDRGFQYGDGVFETLAIILGKAEFVRSHLKRLRDGCKRLKIFWQDEHLLYEEIAAMAEDIGEGVLKVIVSREGGKSRGYRPPSHKLCSQTNRTLWGQEMQLTNLRIPMKGEKVCICTHRLPRNLPLAGMKHLCCLDQIMARLEWEDEYFEGLMLDTRGFVIEGTYSNVFFLKKKELTLHL